MAKSKFKLGMMVKAKLDDDTVVSGDVGAVISSLQGNAYRLYNGAEFVGEFNEDRILASYRPVVPRAPKEGAQPRKRKEKKAVSA